MSCENEMVTWADHHYLHWLYTLLHSCRVISFPSFRAHFKYSDSTKGGGGAVAFTEACLCEFSRASCHISNLRSVTPQRIAIMHDHPPCLPSLNHAKLTYYKVLHVRQLRYITQYSAVSFRKASDYSKRQSHEALLPSSLNKSGIENNITFYEMM